MPAKHMRILVACTGVVTALSMAACINTPLPDYYVLTPERAEVAASALPVISSEVAVGIGPITIPETNNRPNIVTPLDGNQLDVAEYHRWSEPLIDNISRIVIANLASRTSLDKLYAYPWLGNAIDYQVRIDVLQMIGSPGSDVRLQVRWQILSGEKPQSLLVTRIVDYREASASEGYSAMVSAYSRAVARLSDDIAEMLSTLATKGPGT